MNHQLRGLRRSYRIRKNRRMTCQRSLANCRPSTKSRTARAAGEGHACRRRCGPLISLTVACLTADKTSSPAPGMIKRSFFARRYNTGTPMRASNADTSACIASAARCRNTSGCTSSKARSSDTFNAGVAQRPSNHQDSKASGSARTGAKRVSGANGENNGSGVRAKVVDNTKPTRLAGGSAAIDSAIGPEKDSPNSTKGTSLGNAALTSTSSAA